VTTIPQAHEIKIAFLPRNLRLYDSPLTIQILWFLALVSEESLWPWL